MGQPASELNWSAAEAEPVDLADRMAVLDSLARYSWAIDTGSLEEYLDCFTSDGILRHPLRDGSPGEARGRDGIRAFLGKGFANRPFQTYAHQHQFSSVLMKNEGNLIRLKSYCIVFRHEFHRQYWPSGPSRRMGTWHGLFQNDGNIWKLKELDVHMWLDSVFGIGSALTDRGAGMPGTLG
ncbi:nuclear transport factor 2 family protein [Aurantiacibacter xanthus]|nr:nuclear transport factor 2 family protein [Aurantiacibacter xanthus]